MNIVLFSGGVESTYALSKSNKDDIILSVIEKSTILKVNKKRVEYLASYYDRKVTYFQFHKDVTDGDVSSHQINMLYPAASIVVSRLEEGSVKNVIDGWSVDVVNQFKADPVKTALYKKWNDVWKILHPRTNLLYFDTSVTRKEMWESFPKCVQENILSCTLSSNCGKCEKCISNEENGIYTTPGILY